MAVRLRRRVKNILRHPRLEPAGVLLDAARPTWQTGHLVGF
jgi:hypothetical protein